MQVETYECEQVTAETPEMSEEASRLISELDLEGQKKLLMPDADNGSRMPYREITAEERWVFETLCPEQAALGEYDASPIPVRVLQVAAHAQSLGMFGKLLVWAAESQRDPDPVLLGRIGEPWSGKYFLLARWGEELEEWPAMLRKAADRFREQVKAKLVEIQTSVVQELALVDALGAEALRKKGLPSYHR